MKTWRPDTCECVIEELYSGTDIIGGGQVLKKCVAHNGVADSELYDVILNQENRPKNRMLRALLGYESVKGLGLEESKKNADGSDAGLGLKQGVSYSWSFSGSGKNRILHIGVTGATLTDQQKNALKSFADAAFGENKVAID